jgi:dihydrofolate reductase
MKHCKLTIIAAVSVDGVIGIDNEIPWRIPEDFQHFRKTTMGHMLLVGYNTFKTLPPKAFEGREYIVLNNSVPITDLGCDIYQFRDLDMILPQLNNINCDVHEVFVAGGAMIYDTLLDYCDECIITWVNINIPNGNKRFPIDRLFANFVAYEENGWHLSKTNFLYKITHYRKQDIPLNEK